MSAVPDRLLPVDPLEVIVGGRGHLAAALGVSEAQVALWERCGLGATEADAAACRLGVHPGLVWEQWWATYPDGELVIIDLEVGEGAAAA